MLLLDPQRVAELQQRLATRQLREEDFAVLPALLASHRQLAQWLSEEGMTEERLQALILGALREGAEAAPSESPNSSPRVRNGPTARTRRSHVESWGADAAGLLQGVL